MNIDKMNYVDRAEDIVSKQLLKDKDGNNLLTTNQIRNILDLINELYDMVRTEPDSTLSEDVMTHIQYIRMKVVYAAAKDSDKKDSPVKDFVKKSGLDGLLKEIGSSRDNLILVCRYTEALVAVHKYYPHKVEK